MTKPPVEINAGTITGTTGGRRASVAGDGSATIALTAIAKLHVDKTGLADDIAALRLGPQVAVGDVISLERGSARHDFAVTSRRWIAGDGVSVLELTLDYPARKGR